MARLNTRQAARPRVHSPIHGEPTPSGTTHEGGAGYALDPRSELYLRAVSSYAGEKTFYETAAQRGSRFQQLIAQVAADDPQWCVDFLTWLRTDGNMRTAPIIGAAEFVRARLQAGHDGRDGLNRQLVAAVLRRADEPGELIAYWTSNYGMAIPKPIKRGIGDAIRRGWNERSLTKWDSPERPWRFGRVLDLCHPRPKAPWQGALFSHALDRMHDRDKPIPEPLATLRARAVLLAVPPEKRRRFIDGPQGPSWLAEAGMTWEALAGWLQGPMDAKAWEAIIPAMRYDALVKNLRNFDQAGVSDQVAGDVAAVLINPEQIVRAQTFPMRLLAAYRAVLSDRWAWPLEQAIGMSVANVPHLRGRTLVLIDTSTSMNEPFSEDGKLLRWDAAVVFGLAVAARCDSVDVVSFSSTARRWGDVHGTHTKVFATSAGESLLRAVNRWQTGGYFLGGGTDTAGALRRHYRGHDRAVILTDEQVGVDIRDVNASLPASTPLYTWNLAGYGRGHAPAGAPNRHTFGGLTDAAFRIVPLLESGKSGSWPWTARPGAAPATSAPHAGAGAR